jgi:hypothetical protein
LSASLLVFAVRTRLLFESRPIRMDGATRHGGSTVHRCQKLPRNLRASFLSQTPATVKVHDFCQSLKRGGRQKPARAPRGRFPYRNVYIPLQPLHRDPHLPHLSDPQPISRLRRWTVPTPRPTVLTTFPIPIPLASSLRATRFSPARHQGALASCEPYPSC